MGARVKFTVVADPEAPAVSQSFTIEVHPEWAPLGAQRFMDMVRDDFYKDVRFHRCKPGFMVQFGVASDPAQQARWMETIKDDAVKVSNEKGTVSFAMRGPDTRSTQIFINYVHNGGLDEQGFAPFGVVVDGMSVVEQFYGGYKKGEAPGEPDANEYKKQGLSYIAAFPRLSYIKTAEIVQGA